ncbi:murein biosynthesis integral membrane protein MurJ [Amaricoccus tamworthensis]|uniref:murein biosynthesis integral membrane protein MurJ n=1 Tax=Amaricoccus tamworthensis TaxID=57002 RepID=UPI003C7BD05F
MKRSIRLLPAFLTVGTWTLLSRVFGLARDILLASYLGSGPAAQAFLVAFTLPNMFRRFFAEGAFNMAFVPMFAKRLETGDEPKEFARDALSGLVTILMGLCVVAQVFMPWLVLAMASGFQGDERFELSVHYGRIAFPYILFISVAALLSGVLNALGRFAAAAAAPVLMNITMISFLLIGDLVGGEVALWLVWAVPVAGVAQLVLVWKAAANAGYRLVPRRPRLTPELKRLAIIAGPAIIAGGVTQINLLVGRQVGSFFDGAVAWLSFADRLYQLPLGVVGIAIGIVLLPDLARKLGANDEQGSRFAVNRATEFTLALTLPATLALILIPTPLVSVLYERGEFTASDTARTALAVAIYGAGLPAFVLQKVFLPMYYVREDTRTPLRFAVYGMLVNVVVAIALAPVMGFAAAALGTTVAGWVMTLLLWNGSRSMGESVRADARLLRTLPRLILATLMMGGVLVVLEQVLSAHLQLPVWRYGALALLVAFGMATYAAAVLLTGAMTRADIRSMIRR